MHMKLELVRVELQFHLPHNFSVTHCEEENIGAGFGMSRNAPSFA